MSPSASHFTTILLTIVSIPFLSRPKNPPAKEPSRIFPQRDGHDYSLPWYCARATSPLMGQTPGLNLGLDLYQRSKIASLAEETLVHIFTLGAAAEPHHPDAFIRATIVPLVISRVCRRWRVLALRTSRLWSRIFICGTLKLSDAATSADGASHTTNLAGAMCLRRVQAFLERSKSAPLNVYVDVRSPAWFYRPNESGDPFTANHMSKLLDYLLPYVDRWEEVEIISDSWEPFVTLLERCKTYQDNCVALRAGSLRRLALIRANAYSALESPQSGPSFMTYPAPFQSAPVLRCLELAGVHIDWTWHYPCNLTELSLKYHARHVLPTATQLLDIINSSLGIESLSLHGWGVRSFESGSGSFEGRLSLNRLKKLSIGWIDAHYCRRLLSLFSWHLPSLESLTLEDVANSLDPLSSQDSSCILDYIASQSSKSDRERVSCAAFDLTLNSVCASLDSMHRLMKALPVSRRLTLHNVSDELLSFLEALHDSKEPTLTQLSHVIVRTSNARMQARIREIARSVLSSSAQRTIVDTEDLLETDMEIATLEEDGSGDGGIDSDYESCSIAGDDLWLDPAADETIDQGGRLCVASPYAFRDCTKFDDIS